MISISIIAAFAAMLCWGVGDFFIQKSTRKIGDAETLAFIGIIGTVILTPFVFFNYSVWDVFTWKALALVAFLGVVHFIAGIIDFEALKRGKLSVIDAVIELELVITIVFGIFFLGESLSLMQWLLIVPVFVGVVLVAFRSLNLKIFKKVEKGVWLALITAVGFGFVNFLTDVSVREINYLVVIWFSWVVFAILTIAYLAAKRRMRGFYRDGVRNWKLVGVTGLVDTLAWVFFAIALTDASLSITTAITESYPVIALLLGVLVNKERLKVHQFIGGALALGASVALAFTL